MDIKRILWASDGSKESEEALRYVALFASTYGSRIIGLNVIQPVDLIGLKVPPEVRKELFSIQTVLEKREYERMNRSLEQLKPKGIKWDIRVETGVPHEEILRVASEEKVDLIAMGKRGLGLIDRVLIGSTALKVLRNSEWPVLAVKDGDGKDPVEIHRILVPIDISEELDSALNYAMDLAERIGAAIAVVYILRLEAYAYEIPSSVLAEDLMSVLEYLIGLASDRLSKRVEEIRLKRAAVNKGVAGLEIRTEVIHGINPAVSLVDYASSNGIDLIVINTHGRKGAKRLFLGSVTEKVIQESHCPVLAIKP
ncbi:MAG TPA: universal stress protein, partial [Thermodesulfobacteriota bacterium]|nr:universal stress protein [Thermodesulfobacteriota bacterium]